MSKPSRNEAVEQIRWHYQRTTGKKDKGHLLDSLCQITGWERKHATKVLLRHRGAGRSLKRGGAPNAKRGGPRPVYGEAASALLRQLWRVSGMPCGKVLKAALPAWLVSWELRHGASDPAVHAAVLQMSAATMDRHLAAHKAGAGGRRRSPASEVRSQVPLRTGPWDVDGPGWLEADTVAHCGGDLRGQHGWSIVMTDIASGWTEAGMIKGRSDRAMLPKLAAMEQALPFGILGFDSDNGGEFINHIVLRYWRERKLPINVSRSRPYHKNDNAHVEERNRRRVRDLLGHDRIDAPDAVILADCALRLDSLLANLFRPTHKLEGKEQMPSGRWRRKYGKELKTPAQRLLENAGLDEPRKESIRELLRTHDPLSLAEQRDEKLAMAFKEQQTSENESLQKKSAA
jgi:hypothetical protein